MIRKRNDEERRRETDVLRIAQGGEGKDSISVDKLAISETYAVGIDMERLCLIREVTMTLSCVREISFIFLNTSIR